MASRALLEHYDYHVLVAHSGSTGLEILRANPGIIDLIILDWILPDMTGDQWLDILELAPEVSVIFWTAYVLPKAVRRRLEPAVKVILRKPVTADELLGAVREALGSKENKSD